MYMFRSTANFLRSFGELRYSLTPDPHCKKGLLMKRQLIPPTVVLLMLVLFSPFNASLKVLAQGGAAKLTPEPKPTPAPTGSKGAKTVPTPTPAPVAPMTRN